MAQHSDLWKIVNGVKISLGIDDTRFDMQFFKFAREFYDDLNLLGLDVLSCFTTKLQVINGVAQLPANYKRFLKIGLLLQDGRILNLDSLPDLALTERGEPCCDDDIRNAISLNMGSMYPTNPMSWYYLTGWQNGQFVGGLYGVGAGFYGGGYRIDEIRNEIRFECISDGYVIMEYNGTNTEGSNAYVPWYAKAAGEYFINMKRNMFPQIKPDYRVFQRMYELEKEKILAATNDFTITDLYSLIREGTFMTAHR